MPQRVERLVAELKVNSEKSHGSPHRPLRRTQNRRCLPFRPPGFVARRAALTLLVSKRVTVTDKPKHAWAAPRSPLLLRPPAV